VTKTFYILTVDGDASVVDDESKIEQDDMDAVTEEHGFIFQVVVDPKLTPFGYQVRRAMVQETEDEDNVVLEIYDWELVR
jgi:hypothetical protein